MPQWNSVAAFTRDFDRMMDDLTGPEKRKITRLQGVEAQRIAAKAAAHDLGGDKAFSGWVRGNPIPLDTRLRNLQGGNTLLAPTRRSAGPWTVAEQGRNSAAGPRLTGPRLTRTGRVSKARRKRYNGRTRGKDTASEAVKEMGVKLPKIADAGVRRVIRRRFDMT
jgi:hypothetical protein